MTSTADGNFYKILPQGKGNAAILEGSDKRTKYNEQLSIDCDTPVTKSSRSYRKEYKLSHKEPHPIGNDIEILDLKNAF